MKLSRLMIAAVALQVAAVTNVKAQELLVNGGFELLSGSFAAITPATQPAGWGWSVVSGSVDLIELPFQPFIQFGASEGTRILDLNGDDYGSIAQTFSTVVGQSYSLTFQYANNPYFPPSLSSADVVVTNTSDSASLFSGSFQHGTSTNGSAPAVPSDADWTLFSATFVATGAQTTLTFVSTSPLGGPSGGVLLDDVSVTAGGVAPIPEPGSVALMALGLVALALRRLKS